MRFQTLCIIAMQLVNKYYLCEPAYKEQWHTKIIELKHNNHTYKVCTIFSEFRNVKLGIWI